jgi:hypothetical protein
MSQPSPGSQSGWAQPDPAPYIEPPERGTSTGLKVAIGVAVLVVAAAAAVVVLGGGGDDAVDPDSPVGVVQAFYDAAGRNDCEGMVAVLSEATWSEDGTLTREEAVTSCEDRPEDETLPEGTDLDVDLESQAGDTAIVNVSATLMGNSRSFPMTLIREDDQWKIDLSGTDPAVD